MDLGHPKSRAPLARLGYPRIRFTFDLTFPTLRREVLVYCLAFYFGLNSHKTEIHKTEVQKKLYRRNCYNLIYFQTWIRVKLPNSPALSTVLPDMSPRSNRKRALGQRSTLNTRPRRAINLSPRYGHVVLVSR